MREKKEFTLLVTELLLPVQGSGTAGRWGKRLEKKDFQGDLELEMKHGIESILYVNPLLLQEPKLLIGLAIPLISDIRLLADSC